MDVVVARPGEQRPEQHREPSDDRPAEEEVEDQDGRDAVAAVGGDDGGQEVEKRENRECDHRGGLGMGVGFCSSLLRRRVAGSSEDCGRQDGDADGGGQRVSELAS